MNIIFRWAILSFSIFLVERLLKGIEAREKGWYVYVIMALIMAFLNIFLKPVLKFLSCPLMILTLGLFSLIINALIFYFTSYIANKFFHLNFYVRSFWDAILGAFLVSLINLILIWIYKSSQKD